MTSDDIIKVAREAGFRAGHIELYNSDPLPFVASCSATDCLPELERFAALVAAAEREACAKVCEARYMGDNNREDMEAKRIAEAIRARGES